MSFETTKRIKFVLSGVSLDGKTRLWQLKQRDLRPNDRQEYPLSTASTLDNKTNNLFFAMQDEVIALEISTGRIIWRQKL